MIKYGSDHIPRSPFAATFSYL